MTEIIFKYLPNLLNTFVGAIIGLVVSYTIMKIQFNRQDNLEKKKSINSKIDRAKLIIDLIMANVHNSFKDKTKYLPIIVQNLYELKGIIETDVSALNDDISKYFDTTLKLTDTISYLATGIDIDTIIEKFENESRLLREKLQNSRI